MVLHIFGKLYHSWHPSVSLSRSNTRTHAHTPHKMRMPKADETSQFNLREWLKTKRQMQLNDYSSDYLISWVDHQGLTGFIQTSRTKHCRAKDGSRFRSLQRKEETLSFSFQQEAQTFNLRAQKRPVCLSGSLPFPFYILRAPTSSPLCASASCSICAARRHGWALFAADERPDSVCLGVVMDTTGTLTVRRRVRTAHHLVSAVAWWFNTTCCTSFLPKHIYFFFLLFKLWYNCLNVLF